MNYLDSIINLIKNFGSLGYLAILISALAESLTFVGSLYPGSTIIVIAGFLSARGYFNIWYLVFFASLGAILGDNLGYYLGTKGARFFNNKSKILKPSHLEKGEAFFKKHGNKSIFLGRFITPLRPVVPFIAGLSKMSRRSFVVWNIISAVLWAIYHLLLGYFFGGAINIIEAWSTRGSVLILFILSLLVIILLLVKESRPLSKFLKSFLLYIKNIVISNPRIISFSENHPDFIKFLKERVRKDKFYGLPFTLLISSFAYVAILFLGIIEDVISSSAVVATDIRVAHLIFAFRSLEFMKVFIWITLLAKWEFILSSAAAISIILFLKRKNIYVLPLWIAIAGTELFNSLGKLAFHRPRPDTAFYIEKTFSFPSGHSAISVAFYGFIAYILIRDIKQWKRKISSLFIASAIILIIGFSRIYLGVHFLSDVWSGYLLGAMWLIIAISISEWMRFRKKPLQNIKGTKIKFVSLSLALAELIFYINFGLQYNPTINNHFKNKNIYVVAEGDMLTEFNNKLPKFTKTLIGDPQEPISFLVVAKDNNSLINSMNVAGWKVADKISINSLVNLAKSYIFDKPYPSAPITPSFWNASPNIFGFEKSTKANNISERHHARFWKTNIKTINGHNVYVGEASFDSGIKWFIIHKINPNIDAEREVLFNDLKNSGRIQRFRKVQFVDPTVGENFSGDKFFTDGKLYEIILK